MLHSSYPYLTKKKSINLHPHKKGATARKLLRTFLCISCSITIDGAKGGFSDPDIEEGLENEQHGCETQGDRNVGGEGEAFKKEDADPGAAQSDGEGPT